MVDSRWKVFDLLNLPLPELLTIGFSEHKSPDSFQNATSLLYGIIFTRTSAVQWYDCDAAITFFQYLTQFPCTLIPVFTGSYQRTVLCLHSITSLATDLLRIHY